MANQEQCWWNIDPSDSLQGCASGVHMVRMLVGRVGVVCHNDIGLVVVHQFGESVGDSVNRDVAERRWSMRATASPETAALAVPLRGVRCVTDVELQYFVGFPLMDLSRPRSRRFPSKPGLLPSTAAARLRFAYCVLCVNP